MRKNVWKRFLAVALATVVMFTSVDCTGLVVNAESTTKTLGEVVTSHYEISGNEQNVLTHADLRANAKTYDVSAPTDLGTKVKLDVANKTITADSYTKDDGVTWTPSKVVVVFTGSEKEAVADAGVYKYTGEDTVKEVKVTYEASVEVSAEEQLELLNTTHYLFVATEEVDYILSDSDLESYADTIQNSAVPNLGMALSMFDTIKENEQIKSAVEMGQLELPADEAINELKGYVETVKTYFKLADLYAAYVDADKVVYWGDNVSALIDSFENTQEAIEALAVSDTLKELAELLASAGTLLANEDAEKAGNAIKNSYIPAFENYLNNEKVQEFDAEYLYEDKTTLLVDEPTGGFSFPRRIEEYNSGDIDATTLSVGTADVTVEANNRVITVEVSATVIEDNAEVEKDDATNAEVVVALGDDLDAVKNAIAEKVAVAIEEIDPNGTYGLGERTDVYNLYNYNCTVDAGDIEANGVTDNATVSITYAPKTYNVKCAQDEELSGEYAYGYVITLPEATAPKSYDYKVSETESYYQGTKYTVTTDVTFERITNDSEKISKTEKDVAIATHGDKLTATAKDILANAGVSALKEINSREPENGKGLITFDGDTVIVGGFEDGNYVWTVNKVKFMVGDTVVEEFEKPNNGKVVPTKEYDNVVVEYALKIDGVTAEEVVNLPAVLVDESAVHLGMMNRIVGYGEQLSMINADILNLLKYALTDAGALEKTLTAIDGIKEKCLGADKNLKLYAHAEAYKGKAAYSDKLKYYYDNYMAIRKEVGTLADYLDVVVDDDQALNYLEKNGFAGQDLSSYIQKLRTNADALGRLEEEFLAPNRRIDTNNESLRNLLANALYARENKEGYENYTVTTVDVTGPLYWVKEVSEAAPSKLAFKVVVQLADGEGNVSHNKKEKEIIFDAETGLTDADVAAIKAAYTELEAKLTFDKAGYKLSSEGEENIVVGLKKAASVVYTWSPKAYTVTIPGLGDFGFTYDNPVIGLPAHGDPNFRYEYVIDGEVVPSGSYSFVGKIEKLFGTGNHITIEVKEVNIAAEKENEFFEFLAESVEGSGIAVIPTTDKNGAVESVELSIEGSVDSIYSGMMEFMKALFTHPNGYSYYALGGHAVKDKGISIQGIIDALLTSGVSTEDLAAMFKADGSTVTTPGYNGAVLLETEFTYGESVSTFRMSRAAGAVTTVPFVITFKSAAANKEFAALKSGLDMMHKGLVVEGKDGAVVATVKKGVSDEAFEAYLVAMILEGRTTFATVNDVTVAKIIDFEYDRFVGDLKDDHEAGNLTVKTIKNTISKLGKDVDLSEYEATFEKIKAFIYNDGSTPSGSVTFKKAANAAADEYNMVATAKKDLVLGYVGAGVLASMIVDDQYVVPMKVVFDGFEENHDAFVINDPTALKGITDASKKSLQIALNAWNLVQGDNLTVGENTAVILTDNIDEITFAGNGVLDLNGFTVGKITTNGKVVVLDSTYANSGFKTIPTTVGEVTMINESNNLFYSVSEDSKGNTVVKLDAGFLATLGKIGKEEAKAELVPLAVEIAYDIAMNNIASGKMTINDMRIYELGYADILSALEETKPSAANKALDFVDYKGISAFVNDMIATLTDFDALEAAIKNDGIIKTYVAETNALTVEVTTAGTDPDAYLTLNIATAKEAEKTTVKLMVGGRAEDKATLAALCGAFAEIVETFNVTVNLDDVDYVNGGLKAEGAAAKAHIVVDLTKDENYALAMAMIVAYGNPDNSKLLDAINAYLEDGKQSTLKAEVDKITTAQVINAVKAAYGKDFVDIAKALGLEGKVDDAVELEAIYHDLLNVLYRITTLVANYFGIVGGTQQLKGVEDTYGVYGGTHTGTHKGVATDVKLVLKLFKEDAPGGDTPGGDTPGGDTPGGDTPGGDTPGGDTPGGDTPGGNTPGGSSDNKKPVEVHPAPSKPSTPSATTATKTGDANNMVLWISVMGIAAIAVVAVVAMKKRKTK